MHNFVQVGEQIEVVAPTALASGEGVVIGGMFGVATTTAAVNTPVVLRLVGVVTLPKATGALTQFAKVYWDATNKRVSGTATGNSLIGVAARPAASADAVAYVRLDGVSI
jgi:predicted RecA/RadA family phage recombinase